MHRHNLDLIAEYAQGTLADESRARELVESCASCRTEFETQQSIKAQLGTVGSARLSDHESSALHRDLWTELRQASAQKPARSMAWWSAWALGGATVVFVAVGLIGTLSGQDSGVDESFSEVGSALSGGDSPTESAERAADNAPVVAAETTTTSAVGDTSESGFADAEAYESMADEVRSSEPTSLYAFADDPDRLAKSECLVEAGLGEYSPITGFEEFTDLIIAVPPDADIDLASVAFVDPETCKVVHLEE